VLTPTAERGAQTKVLPGLYVTPGHELTAEQAAAFMPDSGLNTDFIADLLSGMLAHERCGAHLYRTCAARSLNPMLQRKYEEFGEETAEHVTILEDLITAAGGNPAYVSPTARAVQGMDSKLVESTYALAGSIDVMTAEMAMLDAVFLAESMDNANWVLLERLGGLLPDGPMKDQCRSATDRVRAQEEDHLTWALETKEKLVLLQAESSAMTTMTAKAEEIVARVRSWFA
jgi:rubrerythrin